MLLAVNEVVKGAMRNGRRVGHCCTRDQGGHQRVCCQVNGVLRPRRCVETVSRLYSLAVRPPLQSLLALGWMERRRRAEFRPSCKVAAAEAFISSLVGICT